MKMIASTEVLFSPALSSFMASGTSSPASCSLDASSFATPSSCAFIAATKESPEPRRPRSELDLRRLPRRRAFISCSASSRRSAITVDFALRIMSRGDFVGVVSPPTPGGSGAKGLKVFVVSASPSRKDTCFCSAPLFGEALGVSSAPPMGDWSLPSVEIVGLAASPPPSPSVVMGAGVAKGDFCAALPFASASGTAASTTFRSDLRMRDWRKPLVRFFSFLDMSDDLMSDFLFL
mmetsp:Transcript_13797/g.40902  ORF Transcript_13797/g.40902 Transcript_13797/m.40902 type:complete len:235 (-) Transcript_13797:1708-2412(-)